MCFISSRTTIVVQMTKMVAKLLFPTFKDESLYVIRMNLLGIPNTLTLNVSCLVLNLSYCPPAALPTMFFTLEYDSMMVN